MYPIFVDVHTRVCVHRYETTLEGYTVLDRIQKINGINKIRSVVGRFSR